MLISWWGLVDWLIDWLVDCWLVVREIFSVFTRTSNTSVHFRDSFRSSSLRDGDTPSNILVAFHCRRLHAKKKTPNHLCRWNAPRYVLCRRWQRNGRSPQDFINVASSVYNSPATWAFGAVNWPLAVRFMKNDKLRDVLFEGISDALLPGNWGISALWPASVHFVVWCVLRYVALRCVALCWRDMCLFISVILAFLWQNIF